MVLNERRALQVRSTIPFKRERKNSNGSWMKPFRDRSPVQSFWKVSRQPELLLTRHRITSLNSANVEGNAMALWGQVRKKPSELWSRRTCQVLLTLPRRLLGRFFKQRSITSSCHLRELLESGMEASQRSCQLSLDYPQGKGPFQPPCLLKHLIWLSCQLLPCLTLTWKGPSLCL